MKDYQLDEEEKKILKAFENGDLVPVKNFAKEKKRYEKYARTFLLKNKNINIRISLQDLLKLKSKAMEEGIPYQTLVSSILHKYVAK